MTMGDWVDIHTYWNGIVRGEVCKGGVVYEFELNDDCDPTSDERRTYSLTLPGDDKIVGTILEDELRRMRDKL